MKALNSGRYPNKCQVILIFASILGKLAHLKHVSIEWVPRSKNECVDRIAK